MGGIPPDTPRRLRQVAVLRPPETEPGGPEGRHHGAVDGLQARREADGRLRGRQAPVCRPGDWGGGQGGGVRRLHALQRLHLRLVRPLAAHGGLPLRPAHVPGAPGRRPSHRHPRQPEGRGHQARQARAHTQRRPPRHGQPLPLHRAALRPRGAYPEGARGGRGAHHLQPDSRETQGTGVPLAVRTQQGSGRAEHDAQPDPYAETPLHTGGTLPCDGEAVAATPSRHHLRDAILRRPEGGEQQLRGAAPRQGDALLQRPLRPHREDGKGHLHALMGEDLRRQPAGGNP